MNTNTIDAFQPREGHIKAALYLLRRSAEKTPLKAIYKRAEGFLCIAGHRLKAGETFSLATLEEFLLEGAKNWKHFAASACTGAEVCQETILRDFYENDTKTADKMVKKMYAGELRNAFCVESEGKMLKAASQMAYNLLYLQALEYFEAQKIREIKEKARTVKADGLFWAFNNEQFEEGLRETGLDKSEVVSFGNGSFGKRGAFKALLNGINAALKELETVSPNGLFAYEFISHECGYTREHGKALAMTRETFSGYTPDEDFLAYLYYAEEEAFDIEL
jgi:hypothetical protein